MGSSDIGAGADPGIPNVARVYDYLLGGTNNFATDRHLAGQLIANFPAAARTARQNRAFLGRAVRYCAEQGGSSSLVTRTRDEIAGFFAGLELVDPGLVFTPQWRPEEPVADAAAHNTPVRPGLVATTFETVRFERPTLVSFRLVRGPVPHVVEHFTLHRRDSGTTVEYSGEMGTDFWAAGRWWGERVARTWEATVRSSFTSIKAEAERR